MIRIADFIDSLTTAIGRAVAWLALAIVLVQFGLVVARYVFGLGSIWLTESVTYGSAMMFMLAAAWTLRADGHVRVDVFYAHAQQRAQAIVDLDRRLAAAAAVRVCVDLSLGALRLALLGDHGALARDQRIAAGLRAQDGDPAVRRLDGAARHRAGDTRGRRAFSRRGEAPAAKAGPALMLFAEILSVLMVAAVIAALLAGYPVALTLAGVSLAFAVLGYLFGIVDLGILGALPERIFGVMTNGVLLAVPLFIFMGVMLERSRIAEDLLERMGLLFGRLRGGLGFSVVIVGGLLAASTGIVGATAVTMGLIMLPAMMRHRYDPRLAAGTVAASATLAQIVPPSTVLVVLGDQLNNAYQSAQLAKGTFAPNVISVSDLFAGAILPGMLLVGLYLTYLIVVAIARPASCPAVTLRGERPPSGLIGALFAPVVLIVAVLGSILYGIATPTEAASVGAVGAMLLAARKRGLGKLLMPVVEKTTQITSMIFLILIGATLFSLVFRALGGDVMVHRALEHLPGGADGAMLAVMLAIFLLGFVMDAFEIIFVVVPIVAPALLKMPGIDPVWFGIMMAVNLQTSYMHPPLGPTLFYLRGVAPREITTRHIYVGIIPFVLIQLFALVVLWFLPGLATALPHALYGGR